MDAKPDGSYHPPRPALDGLRASLDRDAVAAAREYETLRLRLIQFFDQRGADDPESLADETIERVAQDLQDGENVEPLRSYCFGAAQRLWREAASQSARQAVAEMLAPSFAGANGLQERRTACLERCLMDLPAESRRLIVAYYHGPGRTPSERQQLLARQLGLSEEELRRRALRIRDEIEERLRRDPMAR
jgi:DNA-directed RNA polymerase specialized sigma24 family protein